MYFYSDWIYTHIRILAKHDTNDTKMVFFKDKNFKCFVSQQISLCPTSGYFRQTANVVNDGWPCITCAIVSCKCLLPMFLLVNRYQLHGLDLHKDFIYCSQAMWQLPCFFYFSDCFNACDTIKDSSRGWCLSN